jgi:GH24 family phage-related lysozyme (muramidase)|tara:strand:+ start:548 stop:997 length:450 start_codon:yes stop_codon:yes gene_type:complete
MDLEKLKNEIKKEEGYRDVLYSDHLGFATIGYGHLVKPKEKFIKDKKYDRKFLEKIFIYDVNIATRDAKSLCKKIEFDNFVIHHEVIEIITHMCFQLGRTKTAKFYKMFDAIRKKDYYEAGNQMEDSLWAREHTPRRARQLAQRMKKLT